MIHEIGRELYRENLLADTNRLSISLNKYELIVNGVRMPEDVHERIYNSLATGPIMKAVIMTLMNTNTLIHITAALLHLMAKTGIPARMMLFSGRRVKKLPMNL